MAYTITDTCIGCTACTRKCPVHAISGERKAVHRIDPALCIECGVCGRICPSKAILDEEGQLTEKINPNLWAKPVWKYDLCVECRICVLACPTSSINLARYEEKRDGLKPSWPMLLKPATCIACGFCAESCPASAIEMKAPQPAAEPVPA